MDQKQRRTAAADHRVHAIVSDDRRVAAKAAREQPHMHCIFINGERAKIDDRRECDKQNGKQNVAPPPPAARNDNNAAGGGGATLNLLHRAVDYRAMKRTLTTIFCCLAAFAASAQVTPAVFTDFPVD